MFGLFRILSDRLKALFVADVASEFEAELVSREAERRAELLRQAQGYQQEGLDAVADRLRLQADALSFQAPLAGVLPALQHLQAPASENALAAPPVTSKSAPRDRRLLPSSRKAGGK